VRFKEVRLREDRQKKIDEVKMRLNPTEVSKLANRSNGRD